MLPFDWPTEWVEWHQTFKRRHHRSTIVHSPTLLLGGTSKVLCAGHSHGSQPTLCNWFAPNLNESTTIVTQTKAGYFSFGGQSRCNSVALGVKLASAAMRKAQPRENKDAAALVTQISGFQTKRNTLVNAGYSRCSFMIDRLTAGGVFLLVAERLPHQVSQHACHLWESGAFPINQSFSGHDCESNSFTDSPAERLGLKRS